VGVLEQDDLPLTGLFSFLPSPHQGLGFLPPTVPQVLLEGSQVRALLA
jgi:hypothetical protein